MKVAGIIVNYRTAELSARAAEALLPELARAGSAHLYLVDNDSGDGSYAELQRQAQKRGWGERVTLLQSLKNGGYGYGINLAIERAMSLADRPDYFYVINSDAFADPGTVERLVAFMDSHRDAGIAGGHVHGTDGATQGCAFRFPTMFSELESTAGLGPVSQALERFIVSMPLPTEDTEIDWVSGTSMIVRREVIETVGLFDEAFFLYFEEVDYCRRLHARGWKSYFVAGAPVTHIGCVSTGMLDTSQRMASYWFRSRHRYFMKHHGRAYAAAADAAWLAGHLVGRTKYKLLKRGLASRPSMLRDFAAWSVRDLLFSRKAKPDDAKVAPKTKESLSSADKRTPEEVGFVELFAEDFATYDRDLLQPGLWAIVAHRVGRRGEVLENAAAKAALTGAYEVLFTAVDTVWGIHLPKSVRVGRRVRLWHCGSMLLIAREIGNDVHIRHDTTFGPVRRQDLEALPVIEDRADIGSGVAVLGEVTVGHDATIGANSVVMKSVPPRSTVLGVPARIVPA